MLIGKDRDDRELNYTGLEGVPTTSAVTDWTSTGYSRVVVVGIGTYSGRRGTAEGL